MENSLYGIALGIGSSNAAKIQTMMLVWIASSIFFFNGGMNLTLSAPLQCFSALEMPSSFHGILF